MKHVNTDKLVDDLRAVVRDAEELLKATAGQAGEHVAQVRERAEESLRTAREKLAAFADFDATGRLRDAAERADSHVRNNPWISIGAGALAGLVVGLLVGHRNQGGSR